MASECPRRLTTPAPIGAVEVFDTLQNLPLLHIEIFLPGIYRIHQQERPTTTTAIKRRTKNDNKGNEEEDENNKDDDFPSYLLKLVTRLENIDFDYVREEAIRGGDGGDSDVEVNNCLDYDEAIVKAQKERNKEDDLVVDENDRTLVLLSQGEIEAIQNVKIPRFPNS